MDVWQGHILRHLGSLQSLQAFRITCRFCYHVGSYPALVDHLVLQCNDYSQIIRRLMYVRGDARALERLLRPSGIAVKHRQNVLAWACEQERLDVLEWLLMDPRVDPSDNGHDVFCNACSRGHLQVVQQLLAHPTIDPSVWDNYCLQCACRKGHVEIVKLLLAESRVNPADLNNGAIRHAARCGQCEVVRYVS